METSPSRHRSRHADGRPLNVGMRLMRRMFNLHGSAVDNAAASVRDDNVARDARNSAAEAVALGATRTHDDQGPAG